MPLHLVLIGLLWLPWTWPHGRSDIALRQIGSWTLAVRTVGFTGRLQCRLHTRAVDYRRRALVFRFPGRTDTLGAVYRIDGGRPVWAASDTPDLAMRGFAIYEDDLDNPSGGLVRIPEERILGSREVSIQVRAGVAPVRFSVAGFGAALEAARKAGCSAGDFT